MVEYTKFMFDNFVLEDEDKPAPAAEEPQEETEEPESENETPGFPAEEKAEFFPEPEENFPEPEPEIEVEPEPEEPSFSEAEVAQKVQEAETQAYQKGLSEARQEDEQKTGELLLKIDAALNTILKNEENIWTRTEQGFRRMAQKMLTELVPVLQDEQAAGIVGKFLEDNFKNFSHEAKLSFYFNPEVIMQAQELLSRLAHKNDFEGKITLHKDAALAKSDCRIEWENGGVEHDSAALRKQAEELLGTDDTE